MKTTHLLVTLIAFGTLVAGCGSDKSKSDRHLYGNDSTNPGSTPGSNPGSNTLQLTSIAPASGPAGTVVVLGGTALQAVTSVEFNGVPATAVTPVSATQVQCEAPTNPLGLVDVTVVTSSGATATLNNAFTYTAGNGNNNGVLARVGNYGDPTGVEQELLELMNRARRDPVAEGNRVGINFSQYPARPPLTYNADLAGAALGHSNDMSGSGFYGHLNPLTNLNAQGRIMASPYPINSYYAPVPTANLTENIGVGSGNRFLTAQDIHDTFIIDAGLNLPKHREMMLGFGGHYPRTREVGMGHLTGQTSPGQPWTAFITQEFAFNADDKPFVTGVVYNDSSNDNIARNGEGQSGVTVTLSHSSGFSIQTTTATAGGYCFEVLVPGTYTIEINGQSTQVTVGADNAKVDSRNGSIVTY